MDFSTVVIYLGFTLAAYSVVGNDTIQTLGTFLSSNERKKWWVLWLYAGGILTTTLIYGYFTHDGDVSYGRLTKYPMPDPFAWYYILPPIILMLLTRTGIPVSTSFLILTFFNQKNLNDMVLKSISGYAVAFIAAIILYIVISKILEKKFIENPISYKENKLWTLLQWASTGFLWSQWLIQDFANIYVYLPRKLELWQLAFSLIIILSMLAFIIAKKGGAIQSIIKSKTNTVDIRSATLIDFTYGIILFYFKEMNNVPMSTTWVFIGILAGREIALNFMLRKNEARRSMFKNLGMDLVKVVIGLVVSIVLVYIVKYLATL
jgi:zinc transporter ZupT